jgi:hypothetical protein
MQFLSKEILLRAAKNQPLSSFLSITQNFSLGVLCKALHKKPGETLDM